MDSHDEKPAITHITIRLPAAIAEALRHLAKRHDRSLNGEIVRALREYTSKYPDEYAEKNKDKRGQ